MRPGSHYRALIAPRLGIAASGPRVLDAGSGDAALLARLSAPLRVALDPVSFAPPRGITMVQGDATRAPFVRGSFDTILALDVVEHVAGDAALVGELLRLLAPGGTLWVSVPARCHRVFPGFLTPWLHRRWGHRRPGYDLGALLALFPAGLAIEVHRWDEPWYRALYLPLRVLTWLAPPLAPAALGAVAAADARTAEGDRGHYFVRVQRPARADRDAPRDR